MEWFTIPSQCTQPELFHHQRGSASDPCRTTYVRPHACWSEAEPRWCSASHRYSFIERGLSAGNFWRDARDFGRPTASLVPWTGAPGSPPAYVGRKRRAKPIKRSFSTEPLERISETTSPQKENPEGYGLQCLRENDHQPVRKCIHTGPALASEGSMFPSIQRHHKKTTLHI
jgi:hypothetical protein